MAGKPDKRTFIAGGWVAMGRSFCLRQSKNEANQKWQRVAFYCYAKMKPGGVCELKAGELCDAVGSTPTNVYKLIGRAVSEGWLSDGSTPRRLVAPWHDVQMNRESVGLT